MRLWTLHPKYLDARGLVALWREALLAQAVMGGRTRGYTRHPQLMRFRRAPSPLGAIASYLRAVHAEATRRGYRFNIKKIVSAGCAKPIVATCGQLDYEWAHLKAKLRVRAPGWLSSVESLTRPKAHPLFHIVRGAVAEWEVVRPKKPRRRAARRRALLRRPETGIKPDCVHRPDPARNKSRRRLPRSRESSRGAANKD